MSKTSVETESRCWKYPKHGIYYVAKLSTLQRAGNDFSLQFCMPH